MQVKDHTLNETMKLSIGSKIDGRELIYNRKNWHVNAPLFEQSTGLMGWGRVTFTAADIFSSSSLQEGGTALLGWLHQTLS